LRSGRKERVALRERTGTVTERRSRNRSRHFDRIVYLDAQVANGAVKLVMLSKSENWLLARLWSWSRYAKPLR
jgi:hypothetical protein